MRLGRVFGFLLPAAFVTVSVLPAKAATITVDGGAISFVGGPFGVQFGNVTLRSGTDLTIQALVQIALGPGFGFQACDGSTSFNACQPGAILAVGGEKVGLDFLGTATLDGVSHHFGISPSDDALLLIVSASATIPEFGDRAIAVLSGPFDLSGNFHRASDLSCSPNGFPCPGENFSLDGHGTFDVVLKRFPTTGAWAWDSAEFDLQPIPEPGTLLLWGTTAAGLGFFARRHRPRRD